MTDIYPSDIYLEQSSTVSSIDANLALIFFVVYLIACFIYVENDLVGFLINFNLGVTLFFYLSEVYYDFLYDNSLLILLLFPLLFFLVNYFLNKILDKKIKRIIYNIIVILLIILILFT